MEAHHLISVQGANMSGIVENIIYSDYDINVVNNLVFLPATMPGACHLEVQLHRGNHYANIHTDDNDSDISHRKSYHQYVAQRLSRLLPKLVECKGSCEATRMKARNELDEVSQDILKRSAKFQVPLSPVFKSFQSGNETG